MTFKRCEPLQPPELGVGNKQGQSCLYPCLVGVVGTWEQITVRAAVEAGSRPADRWLGTFRTRHFPLLTGSCPYSSSEPLRRAFRYV